MTELQLLIKIKLQKQTNVADFKKQLNELSTSVEEFENNLKAKQDTADVIKQDIDGVSDQIESRQNDIYTTNLMPSHLLMLRIRSLRLCWNSLI